MMLLPLRNSYLSKLFQAKPQLPVLLLSEHLIPSHFVLLIAGHAAKDATQRGLYTFGDLVMRRAGNDTVDECALLVAIRKLEIIQKRAVGGEGAGTFSCRF